MKPVRAKSVAEVAVAVEVDSVAAAVVAVATVAAAAVVAAATVVAAAVAETAAVAIATRRIDLHPSPSEELSTLAPRREGVFFIRLRVTIPRHARLSPE